MRTFTPAMQQYADRDGTRGVMIVHQSRQGCLHLSKRQTGQGGSANFSRSLQRALLSSGSRPLFCSRDGWINICQCGNLAINSGAVMSVCLSRIFI
jgi:hypothetical protein